MPIQKMKVLKGWFQKLRKEQKRKKKKILYRNIAEVIRHRQGFAPDLLTDAMLLRLRSGCRTHWDKCFYLHNLYEYRLMKKGMNCFSAHTRSLVRFRHSVSDLFHPEVVRKLDSQEGYRCLSPEYYRRWTGK